MTYPPQQPYGQDPYGQQQGAYGQDPYGQQSAYGQPQYGGGFTPGGEPPKKKNTGMIVAIVVIAVLVLGGGVTTAIVLTSGDDKKTAEEGDPSTTKKKPTGDNTSDEETTDDDDTTTEDTTEDDPSGGDSDVLAVTEDYLEAVSDLDESAATELVCDQSGAGILYETFSSYGYTWVVNGEPDVDTSIGFATVNVAPTSDSSMELPISLSDEGGSWCITI